MPHKTKTAAADKAAMPRIPVMVHFESSNVTVSVIIRMSSIVH